MIIPYFYFIVRKYPEARNNLIHISTITSKGQTTIPIEIRELLNLKPGDKIAFDVEGRKVTLRAKNLPISALKGIVKSPFKRLLTVKEMDEGITAALTAKYGSKRRK